MRANFKILIATDDCEASFGDGLLRQGLHEREPPGQDERASEDEFRSPSCRRRQDQGCCPQSQFHRLKPGRARAPCMDHATEVEGSRDRSIYEVREPLPGRKTHGLTEEQDAVVLHEGGRDGRREGRASAGEEDQGVQQNGQVHHGKEHRARRAQLHCTCTKHNY